MDYVSNVTVEALYRTIITAEAAYYPNVTELLLQMVIIPNVTAVSLFHYLSRVFENRYRANPCKIPTPNPHQLLVQLLENECNDSHQQSLVQPISRELKQINENMSKTMILRTYFELRPKLFVLHCTGIIIALRGVSFVE